MTLQRDTSAACFGEVALMHPHFDPAQCVFVELVPEEKLSPSLPTKVAMPNQQVRELHFPTVEFVLDAIAGWVNKYRYVYSAHDELGQCSQQDVRQIAKDLGISVSELRGLASKGPGAADNLQKMLVALSVDPRALAKSDPAVMRDLQRLCIVCSQKGRCQHEQAKGTAVTHFREFCPNAYTLDALFKERARQPRH